MNIARMLGIPRDIEAAAEIIADGRTRMIDVGEANGVSFYETASVGMNAAMFATAQHFEDGDYGSPIKVLWTAFRYRPARMKLALDSGDVATRALMVTVSNGAYTGVGMTVAPDARLDDGRFDVRVFRHFSKLELLRHLASIAFGRRSYSPHVSTYRSASVRITSRHPLPARADSQDLGTTPLECVSRHAALRVIVGPDFADGRVKEPQEQA
jgi:diacylglycerol kinase family enzyme